MEGNHLKWRFWIDRGGTFTDCLGIEPGTNRVHVKKILSSDRAPLLGIRQVIGLPPDQPIPTCDIRMGTTLATNALLERKGVDCALVISRGFGDLLKIGDQTRPALFDLRIVKPTQLYREVLEINARCDRNGRVLERPDPVQTKRDLRNLYNKGLRSIAVVVLHSYCAPSLEVMIGKWAHRVGFQQVSLSHRVACEIGLLARGDTTVVDSYLTPLIQNYLKGLLKELPGSRIRIMQSSGGLISAASFSGRNAILSGPAGGVVAGAYIAEEQGFDQIINFDMGGTSTDVSRYGGEFERTYQSLVAGVRLRAPMMRIHTIAAGGGSICRYHHQRFTVGPDSAGADPGPLCYRNSAASELTLTDVNLALGRIVKGRFPIKLDSKPVMKKLEAIAAQLRDRGDDRGAFGVAEGFHAIAIEHMAEAIRKVSIARGYDPREHALMVFGGAGGQHACELARRLQIKKIVFHPLAGVLSAYGIGVAPVSWNEQKDVGRFEFQGSYPEQVLDSFRKLIRQGVGVLQKEGFQKEQLAQIRRVDVRYQGTETALTVEAFRVESLRERFEEQHQRYFGYIRENHPIEVVVARVELIASSVRAPFSIVESETDIPAVTETQLWQGGAFIRVPVYPRESLQPNHHPVFGPAIVSESTGAIVIEAGFRLDVGKRGLIVLTDISEEHAVSIGSRVDPVQLELFNHRFMSIAEQMGVVLQRTAISINIRERLDFSCAVFDRLGQLIANAPHIPVHLGAMSESIRGVLEMYKHPEPGWTFATNDPSLGGSHLPDITVITPVFDQSGHLIFFVASRGHHADIGGLTPGSMPPHSTRLDQEGTILRALPIVRNGRFLEDELRKAFSKGAYPSRDIEQNLVDLQAQLAANQVGVRMLFELVDNYGIEAVTAYMGHVRDNAESIIRQAISRLTDGESTFVDTMDDGTAVALTIRISGTEMEVNFNGTGPQSRNNSNAPRAVTLAAVLYVLRSLIGEDIPLNSGCMVPVSIEIPPGCLLWPDSDRAVVAGNVETSQRIVDVLLGALGKAAASQGTMNNLTFGDERFGYYETIGGGAGAGPDFPGQSGVHCHMTNTKITDPEVLEANYPVRLRRFSIRTQSGGKGLFNGGDGLIRELEFLRPLRVSILSERRVSQPFGLAGGDPGLVGRNLHNDRLIEGRTSFQVRPGDRVRIETPGGGGYGNPVL